MHAVEAHLAAWGATHDAFHLRRARDIAEAMCVRQAARVAAAEGGPGEPLVYEHYSTAWEPDFGYNRGDNAKDMFRPVRAVDIGRSSRS